MAAICIGAVAVSEASSVRSFGLARSITIPQLPSVGAQRIVGEVLSVSWHRRQLWT
jgi:hypothetical protein